MTPTLDQLRAITKSSWTKAVAANAQSIFDGLTRYGDAPDVGLNLAYRVAHFLPQLMHESGGFRFDKEIWGPTAAQKGYEGRKDLGNTMRGDGLKFKGRGPIQLTGRRNYQAFSKWAKLVDPKAPDFVREPDLVNTDPWEGLAPIWFWTQGNQTGKSLNHYADQNNIEMITRKINGGLNGYGDRLNYYTRAGLVLLGYAPTDIDGFQLWAKSRGYYSGLIDNIDGPKTRDAIDRALRSPKTEA